MPQEYRLALRTCNLGTKVKEIPNPFDGRTITIHFDDGLTEAEREAVRKLLAQVGASEPDPETYCQIRLPDGSRLNVAIGTLNMAHPCIGFAVEFTPLSTAVVEFVFALALAGNMTVGSSIDPSVVAILAPGLQRLTPVLKARLHERRPTAQVVGSPLELEAWLRERIKDRTIV